ncbi:hypothetical protein ACFW1A_22185 [Kitasatospora sp. NPDC058965]|uniref:TolB family protein n=1 Tax=Kitasatospora sp. NPDC058965 TaxID=3346682 RepID=UPI00369FF51A
MVSNAGTHGRLTVSNGTSLVWIAGRTVDFGTPVRDLAWSPDGNRAAFVDGSGDLVVSDPTGGHRTVVAHHPAGQNWSHPTWQVAAADPRNQQEAKDNLIFTTSQGGTTRLMKVVATAHEGTPEVLRLGNYSDPYAAQLPQTGNTWANGGGNQGSSVYANTGDGLVYLRDDYLRQQGGAVAKGSEPDLSADGREVVFVSSVNGHDHLFAQDVRAQNSVAKDLTPGATTDYTEPVWSPDGAVVAARTAAGIALVRADGTGTPVLVSTATGLPAYRG